MTINRSNSCLWLVLAVCLTLGTASSMVAQEAATDSEEEFGPVVRAYLGYLKGEQEVVDDRASRHEVSQRYYRRNSNRIRALRQIAVNIARETNTDYLPELEAAARDELKTLFDKPPRPATFRIGQVLNNTFRYLGQVRTGEIFYVFARLSPYEQTELTNETKVNTTPVSSAPNSTTPDKSSEGKRIQDTPTDPGSP